MFYVGFCPVCENGPLGIRICAGAGDAIILCDECDAVWLSVPCDAEPIFPDQPDLPCPKCGGSLLEHPAHWATREELDKLPCSDAVIGHADSLSDGEHSGAREGSEEIEPPSECE